MAKAKISYSYERRADRTGIYTVGTARRGNKAIQVIGRTRRAAEAKLRRGMGQSGG